MPDRRVHFLIVCLLIDHSQVCSDLRMGKTLSTLDGSNVISELTSRRRFRHVHPGIKHSLLRWKRHMIEIRRDIKYLNEEKKMVQRRMLQATTDDVSIVSSSSDHDTSDQDDVGEPELCDDVMVYPESWCKVDEDERMQKTLQNLQFLDHAFRLMWPRLVRFVGTEYPLNSDLRIDDDKFKLGAYDNIGMRMIVQILPLKLGEDIVSIIGSCNLYFGKPGFVMPLDRGLLQGQNINWGFLKLWVNGTTRLEHWELHSSGGDPDVSIPKYHQDSMWEPLTSHSPLDTPSIFPEEFREALKSSNHAIIDLWTTAYACAINVQQTRIKPIERVLIDVSMYAPDEAYNTDDAVRSRVSQINIPYGPDYCLPIIPIHLLTCKFPSLKAKIEV